MTGESLTFTDDEVLRDLDFEPGLGPDTAIGLRGAPERVADQTLSPVTARALGFVAEQGFTLQDGSGDRNFPEINAFNSSL